MWKALVSTGIGCECSVWIEKALHPHHAHPPQTHVTHFPVKCNWVNLHVSWMVRSCSKVVLFCFESLSVQISTYNHHVWLVAWSPAQLNVLHQSDRPHLDLPFFYYFVQVRSLISDRLGIYEGFTDACDHSHIWCFYFTVSVTVTEHSHRSFHVTCAPYRSIITFFNCLFYNYLRFSKRFHRGCVPISEWTPFSSPSLSKLFTTLHHSII